MGLFEKNHRGRNTPPVSKNETLNAIDTEKAIDENNNRHKKSDELTDKEKENLIFERTIDYFISQEAELMRSLNEESGNREAKKNKIKNRAKDFFLEQTTDKKMIEDLLVRFERYMWGYYVLEPLIRDPDIQDITLYNYRRIRVEKYGTWYASGVEFADKADYKRFISTICTRNKVALSRINAQPKFTDTMNDPDYILRFNLSYGILNADGETELHIRKIPKNKLLFSDLVKAGYMTKAQEKFLTTAIKSGKNTIFLGANGSGKTYGLNAGIEKIPFGKSGLIMQESDELFTENPDFLVQHVLQTSGEGKISYGLGDLSNIGLMDARDVFVLGEVKSGKDAAYLPTITTTGSQVLLTSHGNNELDGIYKIADYIKQATGYEFTQCLRFLTNFIVIHIEKFKIKGMSYVKNWDYAKNDLVIYKLDENGNRIKSKDEQYLDEFEKYFV